MGLVAEFDVECPALPLTGVAAEVPGATLTLDLQFAHGDGPLFVVTVRDGAWTAVEDAFADAHDVDAWTLVGRAGATRRYQLHPALSLEEQLGEALGDLEGLEALATADAIVERIEVLPEGWRQTGWFADRDAFAAFSSFWQRTAGFRLRRLAEDGEPEPAGDGLTDRQREALRVAYELGYFEIPREATLADVAAALDVAPSSVSERLRRAQTLLVEETVATTWPPLAD